MGITVTQFIQSAILKKRKRMKFAYGLVLVLLTFTQVFGHYNGEGKGKREAKPPVKGKGKLEKFNIFIEGDRKLENKDDKLECPPCPPGCDIDYSDCYCMCR